MLPFPQPPSHSATPVANAARHSAVPTRRASLQHASDLIVGPRSQLPNGLGSACALDSGGFAPNAFTSSAARLPPPGDLPHPWRLNVTTEVTPSRRNCLLGDSSPRRRASSSSLSDCSARLERTDPDLQHRRIMAQHLRTPLLPPVTGGSSGSHAGYGHVGGRGGDAGRRPSSVSWHDERVLRIFQELDVHRRGEVTIGQLQESLSRLHIYLSEELFADHAKAHLRPDSDRVSEDEFLAFHQAVAGERTAARRHSSESAISRPAGGELARSASWRANRSPRLPRIVPPLVRHAPLQRSNSLSSLSGASHGSNHSLSERPFPSMGSGRLREIFDRHSQDGDSLTRSELMQLFKELGMDLNVSVPHHAGVGQRCRFADFVKHQFQRADQDGNGRVSFEEFVEYHRKYTAVIDDVKASDLPSTFRRAQRPRAFGG